MTLDELETLIRNMAVVFGFDENVLFIDEVVTSQYVEVSAVQHSGEAYTIFCRVALWCQRENKTPSVVSISSEGIATIRMYNL